MFEHILIWKITTKNDNVQQRIESIQKDFVLFSTNVTLIIVRHSNKTWAQCKQTHFIYGYLYIYRICKQKQGVEKKAASNKLLFPRERHTHRKFITNYKKKERKESVKPNTVYKTVLVQMKVKWTFAWSIWMRVRVRKLTPLLLQVLFICLCYVLFWRKKENPPEHIRMLMTERTNERNGRDTHTAYSTTNFQVLIVFIKKKNNWKLKTTLFFARFWNKCWRSSSEYFMTVTKYLF